MRDDVTEPTERLADASALVHEEPAHQAVQREEPEVEPCGDAEVPTAATQAPQQLSVLVLSHLEHGAVGRDELRPDQVVARQTVLRRKVADPAAERETGDARRHDDAARRDEARGLRRRVEVSPRGATAGVRDPARGVDPDLSHL
jgi:hypothetical protein